MTCLCTLAAHTHTHQYTYLRRDHFVGHAVGVDVHATELCVELFAVGSKLRTEHKGVELVGVGFQSTHHGVLFGDKVFRGAFVADDGRELCALGGGELDTAALEKMVFVLLVALELLHLDVDLRLSVTNQQFDLLLGLGVHVLLAHETEAARL